MARILIVDDDPAVARTIERALRMSGHETTTVYNGWDAIDAAAKQRPDLIILDIVMPDIDGVEVCKRLRSDPDTALLPIIFLTAKAMIEDKIEGFEAGADDYLTKPFSVQELEVRVRAILRRVANASAIATGERQDERKEDQDILRVGDLELNCRTFEISTPERTALLTPVEFELLSHLMEHPGEIFSSERLLQDVWKYPPGTGDPALVRMHIRNLRTKIEPSNSPKPVYIRTVNRRGYTIRAD